MKSLPLVFVASPVSHPEPHMVRQRVAEAGRFAAWVIAEEGKMAFAGPCHLEFIFPHVKGDVYAWMQAHSTTFMSHADECYVLCLEGWEKSTGIKQELKAADDFGKPVSYYQVEGDTFARFTPEQELAV